MSETVKSASRPTVMFYDHKNQKWMTVIEDMSSMSFPLCSTFEVTPEWADTVLKERNTENRRLDSYRVKKYVRDVIDNHWMVNNDDICFDKDGILLNGQHRLAAVVEAKRVAKMSFKFGLDDKVLSTIDEGKTRTNLDVIKLMHQRGNHHTLSAANYVMEQMGIKRTCPRVEQLEFHERHFDAAAFACQLTASPFARNPVHAAILRAWYHCDRDRLKQFIDILQTGIYDGNPEDSAAVSLRRYIDAHRLAQTGPARNVLYAKTESAISHFCNRHPITRLYGTCEELFPLPEEQLND